MSIPPGSITRAFGRFEVEGYEGGDRAERDRQGCIGMTTGELIST
jgi:hypothetical protein